MLNESLYFKETDFIDTIEKDVTEIFSSEEAISLFDTQIYVSSDFDAISDSLIFPCVFIDIESSSANLTHAVASQAQQYSDFILTFEIYSKQVKDITPAKATKLIAEFLIKNLQQKYNLFVLSSNRPLPNLDITISRRMVSFRGTINNQTFMVYSG